MEDRWKVAGAGAGVLAASWWAASSLLLSASLLPSSPETDLADLMMGPAPNTLPPEPADASPPIIMLIIPPHTGTLNPQTLQHPKHPACNFPFEIYKAKALHARTE